MRPVLLAVIRVLALAAFVAFIWICVRDAHPEAASLTQALEIAK